MPQKAKQGEPTLLEFISKGKVRTSEELPTLSESEFVQKWGLPLITGVEMETEDYDPGALDAAFASLGFVGGSLKTGYKLGKKSIKKAGQLYKKLIKSDKLTPRRVSEAADEFFTNNPHLQFDLSDVQEAIPVGQRSRTPIETLRDNARSTGYQRGDYAREIEAIEPSRATREAIDSFRSNMFRANQPIERIVNEFGVSSNVSWNEAEAIISDIGEQGWLRYRDELRSLPIEQRELHLENFLSKYRSSGTLIGQNASVAYKSRKFTSKMPDEKMTISKGRHGELKYMSTTTRSGESRIYLNWSGPRSSAKLEFDIKSRVDDAGNAFEEISGIHFFAHQQSKKYAGLLMKELLNKIPENAVISESSMTYDALYTLLRQSIKHNAKIVFSKVNPKLKSSIRRKQSSSIGRLSPWSEQFIKAKDLYKKTGNSKHIDEAVDKIMDEFRGTVNEYAKKHPDRVVGRPQIKAIRNTGDDYLSHFPEPKNFSKTGAFEYNMISIHKMTAALAGILGYSNKEEFMKFLSYNPESTESQIFDNEFSF